MLHVETVNEEMLELIKRLSVDRQLSEFYLVGGTALSLQLGHRASVDVDLFTQKKFDSKEISGYLKGTYGAEVTGTMDSATFGFIGSVKVDIVAHPHKWLASPIVEEGIRMASLDDIAAMKLNAIVHSGTRKKDFIDIYALLEHRTLNEMTEAYERKYQIMNAAVAKQALLYHKDIEKGTQITWLDRPQRLWIHIADRLEDAVYSPNNRYTKSLDWKSNEESDSLTIFEEYQERYLARISNNLGESTGRGEGNGRGYGYGYEQ